jgi:O-antigen/teichoic acid export membrane protein
MDDSGAARVALGPQMRRLGRHSAIYGLGGMVSRILAVFLLPLYTRYLDRDDFGAVGVVVALSAVLVTILRLGISSAFFRFYFDSTDREHRRLVVRTSFWFTMASATVGLAAGLALASPFAELLALDDPNLVRAGFVGIWAQMNYEQLTALFRAEERSTAFVVASLANIAVTIGATVLLVVVLEQGAIGVIVGSFTGTLAVYLALLAVHREQLGLQFSRPLLREMNRFGIPLVPAALALIAVNFSDRFFLVHLAGLDDVGLYEIGVRIASAMVLLLTAFRMAWPAFAYSIEDDNEAKRTYAFVLTYLVVIAAWLALTLGLLAPWLVRLLTQPQFYDGQRVVPLLAFGGMAYAAYIVMAIGVGRAKRTQFNWAITGLAAAVNVALNVILIPPYGIMGAAVATVAAYAVMFLAMTWYAQRIFPTPYQWRRVLTAAGAGVALLLLGTGLGGGLGPALAIVALYPLALLALGFYLPAELTYLRRLASSTRRRASSRAPRAPQRRR